MGVSSVGRLIAANFTRRTRQVAALGTGLRLLATEIDYAATPLPLALERVARSLEPPVADIFRCTAAGLGKKGDILAAEAWSQALARVYPQTSLHDRELSILGDLGPALGVSGRQDQLRHLNLAIERVRMEEDTARGEEARGMRLWSYLGYLGGILLAILFL